jgi:CHASE2 domain-containing sensor protein/signal transduction histidine kinase
MKLGQAKPGQAKLGQAQPGQARPWRELLWRLLPGSLIAALVGGLQVGGLIAQTEQLSYDRLFQWRGARAWDPRVVVVAIDDVSLQKLGRYPWPRRRFTELLKVLHQSEVNTVAFDLILSEPAIDDPALAQAIAQQGTVVLAQAVDFNGLPLQPVQPLQTEAVAVGHIYRRTDSDGVTRHIPYNFRDEPPLSVMAQQAYGFTQSVPAIPQNQRDLWLNWVGPVRQLPQYAFVDVLSGQVPTAALKDKIVIVGVSATGFDTLATPFDRNPTTTGTYLHATALNNLLNANPLTPIGDHWPFVGLWLLAMPLFGTGLSYLKVKWQVLLVGGLVILWWGGAVGALHANYYLPTVLPIALLIGTSSAVAIIERLRMHEFLQGQLEQLTQHYLPPVAGNQPTGLALGSGRSPWKLQLPAAQPASLQTLNQLTAITAHLGQAQATQQAITQSLSVGILAINAQGTIWYCNETAQRWLPVTIGDPIANRLVPLWLDSAQWADLFQQFLTHQQWQHETAVLVNDRWFSLSFSPLQTAHADGLRPTDGHRDHPPASPSLVLLIEDITSRKQIETNLERQIQELQWLAQLKDELIGRVSHELRSPITNMLVSIELMRTTTAPDQQARYLDLLETECLQERDFINDLLNLQVPQLEAPQRQFKPIQLATWLPNLVAPFVARGTIRQQTISVAIAPKLPLLYSDAAIVERIYQELLTNACKYSPAGAAIYCTASATDSEIHLSVRNLGVTIPPEELPRIFEKFYRIPESDPWKQGGTGLGLSIADRLAQQIDAHIQVRSEADVTEFQLQLPLQRALPDQSP